MMIKTRRISHRGSRPTMVLQEGQAASQVRETGEPSAKLHRARRAKETRAISRSRTSKSLEDGSELEIQLARGAVFDLAQPAHREGGDINRLLRLCGTTSVILLMCDIAVLHLRWQIGSGRIIEGIDMIRTGRRMAGEGRDRLHLVIISSSRNITDRQRTTCSIVYKVQETRETSLEVAIGGTSSLEADGTITWRGEMTLSHSDRMIGKVDGMQIAGTISLLGTLPGVLPASREAVDIEVDIPELRVLSSIINKSQCIWMSAESCTCQ